MSTLMPEDEPELGAASPVPGSDGGGMSAEGVGSSPLTFMVPTAALTGAAPVGTVPADAGPDGAAPADAVPPDAGTPGGRPGARRRTSYTVHIGAAGRITLASRDNAAAGTHRPATLRVGARGSVVMISAAGLRKPPPIPPE